MFVPHLCLASRVLDYWFINALMCLASYVTGDNTVCDAIWPYSLWAISYYRQGYHQLLMERETFWHTRSMFDRPISLFLTCIGRFDLTCLILFCPACGVLYLSVLSFPSLLSSLLTFWLGAGGLIILQTSGDKSGIGQLWWRASKKQVR